MKWLVVTVAPDQPTAEMWRELLLEAGIPARIHPDDVTSFLGVSNFHCRLLVPEDRVAEASATLPLPRPQS